MFKFLTSKKGFTLVELMIVLILLSLGAFALVNLFGVASRSFDKSEERYKKQEAVKEVAAKLQTGSASVAAAQSADIFSTVDVVPCGKGMTDTSYSYLFAAESKDENGVSNGYFLYVQNRGMDRSGATKLSDVPIYVTIKQHVETKTKKDINNQDVLYLQKYNGVTITLAALEDDYDYSSGVAPTADDIYYSLDVAYHFPNMATSDDFAMVNHISMDEYSTATLYKQVENNENGALLSSVVEATHCTRNCQNDHCGSNGGMCENKNCACPDKKGVVLRVYCDSIIAPDNTESAVSVPSMCFIATASYGLESGEVGMLCEFRDNTLKNSALGREFIKVYYKYSPAIAEAIEDNETLKGAVRVALKPLVVVAEYANNEEIRTQGLISLICAMGCGTVSVGMLIRLDIRRKKEARKERQAAVGN